MFSQVALLLMCLAGLTAAVPSRQTGQSSASGTALNGNQLQDTANLIKNFMPALFQAITDENSDPNSRLKSIMESSLLLSRETLKLTKLDACGQQALEEVDATIESLPLIFDIVQTTMNTFGADSSFADLFNTGSANIKLN